MTEEIHTHNNDEDVFIPPDTHQQTNNNKRGFMDDTADLEDKVIQLALHTFCHEINILGIFRFIILLILYCIRDKVQRVSLYIHSLYTHSLQFTREKYHSIRNTISQYCSSITKLLSTQNKKRKRHNFRETQFLDEYGFLLKQIMEDYLSQDRKTCVLLSSVSPLFFKHLKPLVYKNFFIPFETHSEWSQYLSTLDPESDIVQQYKTMLMRAQRVSFEHNGLMMMMRHQQHPTQQIFEEKHMSGLISGGHNRQFNYNAFFPPYNTFLKNITCLNYQCLQFQNITHLDLGILFNDALVGCAGESILPPHLKYLELGTCFNQPLSHNALPQSLRVLCMGEIFNQPLEIGHLPPNLIELDLGKRFNQYIGYAVLPQTLEILNLGPKYNKTLYRNTLPHSLKELHIGAHYTQPIQRGVLPESLQVLLFSPIWRPLDIKYVAPLAPLPLPSHIDCVRNDINFKRTQIYDERRNRMLWREESYSMLPPRLKILCIFMDALNIMIECDIALPKTLYYLKISCFSENLNWNWSMLSRSKLKYLVLSGYSHSLIQPGDLPDSIEFLKLNNPPQSLYYPTNDQSIVGGGGVKVNNNTRHHHDDDDNNNSLYPKKLKVLKITKQAPKNILDRLILPSQLLHLIVSHTLVQNYIVHIPKKLPSPLGDDDEEKKGQCYDGVLTKFSITSSICKRRHYRLERIQQSYQRFHLPILNYDAISFFFDTSLLRMCLCGTGGVVCISLLVIIYSVFSYLLGMFYTTLIDTVTPQCN